MSTLTIGNIKWNILTHESKAAFSFGKDYAIGFDPASKAYVLVVRGAMAFISKSVSECLEASTEIVLDDCASQYVPVWD